MSKPPEPVRVKLYGLFNVTRRGYYVLLALGVLLLAAWLLCWANLPRLHDDPDAMTLTRAWVWSWNNMPWLILGGVLLASVEVWLVLRKFGREEAAHRARQNAPQGGA
jgi:hypothetical protein